MPGTGEGQIRKGRNRIMAFGVVFIDPFTGQEYEALYSLRRMTPSRIARYEAAGIITPIQPAPEPVPEQEPITAIPDPRATSQAITGLYTQEMIVTPKAEAVRYEIPTGTYAVTTEKAPEEKGLAKSPLPIIGFLVLGLILLLGRKRGR